MDSARARADQAEAARAASEADRDAAIEQARAEASQQVRAAGDDRDQALARAVQAEQAARLAQQDAAQAAEQAARAETDRVRADADEMLTGFRADAARDRDELRADLRARAERAERQADAYGDELVQLRAGTSHDAATTAHQTNHPAVTHVALAGERRVNASQAWPESSGRSHDDN
jgi:hypothetical protein